MALLAAGLGGLGYVLFFLLLARLSLDDWREGMLYDRLVFPLAFLGMAMAFLEGAPTVVSACSGALLGGGLLFLVRLLSRGGLGGGDVKLAAALGVWTGLSGILPALFCAFLLGSVWSIVLLLRGYGRLARLPFGPCLAVGGIVGVFFGEKIASWYEAFL